MGRQGIRTLKTRVEQECSISRQRGRLYSGGTVDCTVVKGV